MNNIDKTFTCEYCGKEITEDYRKEKKGSLRFCSRKCANSFASRHNDHSKLKDAFCSVCGEPIKIKDNASTGRCDKCKSKYHYPEGSILGDFERSKAYLEKSINLKRLGFDFNNNWELEFFKVRDILYDKYYRERMSYPELKKYFRFPSHKNIPEYLKLFGLSKIRNLSEGIRVAFQKGTSTLNTPKISKYLTGWEDGFYYRSSYELSMIRFLKSRNIEFQCNTFKVIYKSSKDDSYHTAFPDFYIPDMNLIIEMKSVDNYDEIDLKDRYKIIKKMNLDFIILFCHMQYKGKPIFKRFGFLNYFSNKDRLPNLLNLFGINL